MLVTTQTTVQEILDAYPGATEVFLAHDVDVPAQCDECILDTPLEMCDSMCHVDDLDALIGDLQKYVDSQG